MRTLRLRSGQALAGSKSVARYQRVNIGTRETHDVPARVWANKPLINGKEAQMASWESDQLVVVMKQGNACGAKGLAGRPRSRDTSSGHGTGAKKKTKLDSMTYSTEGEEVVLKSRMQEICKSGSVRGLVADSPKRGGGHEAYTTNPQVRFREGPRGGLPKGVGREAYSTSHLLRSDVKARHGES